MGGTPQQMMLGGIVRPLIVGIAGCSGSGKTTLARELALELEATLFTFDFYYRDLAHLPVEQRARHNFDHPDSLQGELLLEHLQALAESCPVERPVYDFATHTRVMGRTDRIEPSEIILVEGILALHFEQLRALYDFSIYVDCPHDICLARRIYRDVRERGRTEDSVREQFEMTTRPMADLYVVPTREYASIVVDGCESLDWSVERVLTQLHALKLLPGQDAGRGLKHFGFIRHRIVAPVVVQLRRGASPETIAWSVAVGMVIGINPLIGSTTLVTLALAGLFRLNVAASQIGTHAAYPLQLLLFLPFLHAGTVVFGTGELPLAPRQIMALARAHPWDVTKLLWTWEWHALIVWFGSALVLTPAVAVLLTRVLTRAMPATRHREF